MRMLYRHNLICYLFNANKKVFLLHESPALIDDFARFNGVFNLTSTYRIGSDFPGHYEAKANFEWSSNEEERNKQDLSNGEKISLAAAIISNCLESAVTSARMDYINEMRKHINVDVFGACGIKCGDIDRERFCKHDISRKYKFFLAFENSFCKEYISEKFFDTIRFDIVPVVLGDGPYEYYVR
jgi:hypothetical protein